MITAHHLPSVGSRGHHGYLLIHTIQSAYGVASCWNRCLLNSFCGTGVTSPQVQASGMDFNLFLSTATDNLPNGEMTLDVKLRGPVIPYAPRTRGRRKT